MAAPLGPRLPGRGGAQQARPDACVREDRRGAGLSRHRRESRDEEQGQVGAQGGVTSMARRPVDLEAPEAEIDRVRSLGLDELRTLWRTTLRSSPPPALTKDLVARFICWHIQEQALGGLDPDTAKLLDIGRAHV